MWAWIAVLLVWLLMLVLVLAVYRVVGKRSMGPGEDPGEEQGAQAHPPNAAWREVDAQVSKHGAGHPLQ
jgi:hypothetical protein